MNLKEEFFASTVFNMARKFCQFNLDENLSKEK